MELFASSQYRHFRTYFLGHLQQYEDEPLLKASLSLAVAVFVIGAGVSHVEASSRNNATAASQERTVKKEVRGKASWYGPGFHGRRTANGEIFNANAMTAAHRTLPFGSKVRVTSQASGRSVVVRINDRGPFVGNRIIDLSKASAQALGISGLGLVSLSVP